MNVKKATKSLSMTAALFLGFAVAVPAQAYPDRPVKVVVPYAAGGATDTLARLIAQKMTDATGQPFIVENRPGASAMIGTDLVAKSTPDGTTILFGTTSFATAPLILKEKVPYKTSDLVPVGVVAKTPLALEVSLSVPAKTVQEFVAYAKANPGKLNYATFGKGTTPHVTCEMLNQALGINMLDVPYKGAAPAMNDLISGQIQVFCDVTTTSVPLAQSNKSRVIAIMNETRIIAAPEIPTFAELGYPDILSSTTFGLLAPAATPRPIIDRLNAELQKVLKSPDIVDRIVKLASVPMSGTPEDFGAIINQELTRWTKILKTLDLSEKK